MKKLTLLFFVICACNYKSANQIDNKHVEELAVDFMKTNVIPKMKEPRPYEIEGAQVVKKTVADQISDYRFTYDHLSLSREDSIENKKLLDSIIAVSKHPDSVISITVNVAYKTKYRLGDIVTDSIKLGYNPGKDKITLWPF